MANAATLHWYRTESHASPLGYELRAEHRGRTWRMYRLADSQWKVVPTDRPQQAKTFWKPEDARKYASQAAMTNPGRRRNPQDTHMATKTKNPTSKRKWIRVPDEWLRPGMIVKAPKYVHDFFRDDEPKIKWQDWPEHYRSSPQWDPQHAFPDPMPTRLRVDYWGEGNVDPGHDDGESRLVAIDKNGRETGASFDWNTGAYENDWLVEADSIDDLDDAARSQGQYPPSAENPIRGARKAVSTEVDDHAAQELRLFIDNDGTLYRQRRQPIEKNLVKKWKKGTFDADRATDAYMYLVDDGAKKYAKDFGGTWNEIFPKATRRYVADDYATDFAHDLKEDPTAYDHLLEKNPQRITAAFQPTYTVQRDLMSKRWYVHDDHLRTVAAKRGYETEAQATRAAQRLAKPERGTVRRKNPRRTKNGAGLGALIGSTIGAVAGFGAGSVPLAALGSLAGGTVGGYFGAPKDRKKRGAAGGAIGGALLGPVGAGIGGYVGGTKADKDYGGRRSNPSRKVLREQNPAKMLTITTRDDLRREVRDRFALDSDDSNVVAKSLWMRHDAPHRGDWGPWLDALSFSDIDTILGRKNNPGKALREQNPDSIDDIIEHTEGLRVSGEDEVYSLRGYQFEIYGPSSGRYVVELRDPQGNYATELTAGSKVYALKEAIHFIKVSTDPDYRNNPGTNPSCGCSHRTASMSRRICNV